MEGKKERKLQPAWLLLFWPAYLTRYFLIENLNPAKNYFRVWVPLDDRIPFCEWFLIPYVLWYVAMVALHLYMLANDVENFRRYTRYLIVTMLLGTVVFLLFPTYQDLRPGVFPRNNWLTQTVALLYRVDTDTNVLPSEHMTGAIGLVLGAWHTRKLRRPPIMAGVGLFSLLVGLSTLFLKQHSVLDLLAALPVSALAYLAAWGGGGWNYGKTRGA